MNEVEPSWRLAMSRRTLFFAGIAAASVALLAVFFRPVIGATPGDAARDASVAAATPVAGDGALRTVSVSGEGQVKVTPDLAYVTFAVETNGADLATAQTENATRMAAVLEKLKALGIASPDLQTTGYYVAPQYDKDQKAIGYPVGNGVRATVRDLTKLGATIDATVAVGANHVSGIAFDVANKAD